MKMPSYPPFRPILLSFLLLFCGLMSALEAREAKPRVPLALETFDQVWQILNENHFDTNFNGHDWQKVREKFRPRIAAARNSAAFRDGLQEMLGLLNVSHLAIVSSEEAEAMEADDKKAASLEAADESDSGTLGMELRFLGNDLLVTRVEPALPAAHAGVKPGWILRRIGKSKTADLKQKTPKKLDERRRNFLAWRAASKKLSGAPGTAIALEFLDAGNRPITLSIERAAAQGEPIEFGALPVLYAHLDSTEAATPGRKKVGVIRFNIWMLPTALALNKAIDEHRGKDGIIIDLRGNIGGMVGMIIGAAGHFTTEPLILGTMVDRVNSLRLPANPRLVDTSGKRVQPFAGPVAILVDEVTASASEVFTGGLQEHGRVRVFGRTSAGQALPAVYQELVNGDYLYRPVSDFVTPKGIRFEGRGIVPDESVPLDRGSLLSGRDVTMERALLWIDGAR
jgi:carboxyl-terminal processing protease